MQLSRGHKSRSLKRLTKGLPHIVLIACTAALAACSSTRSPVRSETKPAKTQPAAAPGSGGSTSYRRQTDLLASENANTFFLAALRFKGKPYRFGGSDPSSGFDCSGLVYYVAKDTLGQDLPRSSRELAAQGVAVDGGRLAVGDLVFFNTQGTPNSHVGIYAGGGRFLHAPNSAGTIRLEFMDMGYWRSHFSQARRIF